jgi:hypothetical protein
MRAEKGGSRGSAQKEGERESVMVNEWEERDRECAIENRGRESH